MKSGLIIFIRNPVKGRVKTRLAKTMGDEKAFVIYSQLLLHTHLITRDLSCDKFLYYSDELVQDDIWEESRFNKRVQQPGDLGDRMANAFQELFNEGYQQLLIIGSDCIELSGQVISRAFELLRDNKVVIGPSEDGGYYLLGMTNFLPYLFSNKQWGTGTIFRDTIEDLSNASINAGMLEMLNDIDEEKDIPNSLLQLIRDENPS